jgi:hypothetical protein
VLDDDGGVDSESIMQRADDLVAVAECAARVSRWRSSASCLPNLEGGGSAACLSRVSRPRQRGRPIGKAALSWVTGDGRRAVLNEKARHVWGVFAGFGLPLVLALLFERAKRRQRR